MANAFSPNWNFFVRGDDSSPISGGEIVIRADVSVTFELQ
jgi:uncharacterized protein YggE